MWKIVKLKIKMVYLRIFLSRLQNYYSSSLLSFTYFRSITSRNVSESINRYNIYISCLSIYNIFHIFVYSKYWNRKGNKKNEKHHKRVRRIRWEDIKQIFFLIAFSLTFTAFKIKLICIRYFERGKKYYKEL